MKLFRLSIMCMHWFDIKLYIFRKKRDLRRIVYSYISEIILLDTKNSIFLKKTILCDMTTKSLSPVPKTGKQLRKRKICLN